MPPGCASLRTWKKSPLLNESSCGVVDLYDCVALMTFWGGRMPTDGFETAGSGMGVDMVDLMASLLALRDLRMDFMGVEGKGASRGS
jgi:hypothetical protein